MSIHSLLNTTVDITTQDVTQNSIGEAVIAWDAVATDVPARVSQLSADAVLAAGRLGYQVSHRVYMDTDQRLSIKDRIVFNGFSYEVRAINNAGGHLDRLWQVDVMQLASEGDGSGT